MSPIAHLTQGQKVFAFASMCLGMFIALLDIQIVSASLRDIGGGLSAGAVGEGDHRHEGVMSAARPPEGARPAAARRRVVQ